MLGLTQVEMAKKLGLSINAYRDLEENPEKMKLEQANKFVEIVNQVDNSITLNDIFSY